MSLYCKLAEGTTAEAQGTTANGVGAVGYVEACLSIIKKIYEITKLVLILEKFL